LSERESSDIIASNHFHSHTLIQQVELAGAKLPGNFIQIQAALCEKMAVLKIP